MTQSEFYDAQQATTSLAAREHSPTIFVKVFNNFIKAITIEQFSRKLGRGLSVLDLCCGRGGDIQKWKKQNIAHYVGVDLSRALVAEAYTRYQET